MNKLIAVAIDGTPAGEGAVALAITVAKIWNCKVKLLCTIDAAYALTKLKPYEDKGQEEEQYPAAISEQQKAENIIQKAVSIFQKFEIPAEGFVLVGQPAAEIVAASDRLGASLIVMGHGHLSWMSRLLHPSVCWGVLEKANCPVMVSN